MPLKARSIKVDDDLWQLATDAAAADGEPLSVVIRRLLREYVNRVRKAA
jgi:negative regulator of replication initiation